MGNTYYVYTRTNEGFIWKPVEGKPFKNDYGLELFLYHSDERVYSLSAKKDTWWYIDERSTGLAVSKGVTKKEVIEKFNDLEPDVIARVHSIILETNKKNGYPPDYVPIPGYDIVDGYGDKAMWLHHEQYENSAHMWCMDEEHIAAHPVMVIQQRTEDGLNMICAAYEKGKKVW